MFEGIGSCLSVPLIPFFHSVLSALAFNGSISDVFVCEWGLIFKNILYLKENS